MIILKVTSTASHKMQNQELGMVCMLVILMLDRGRQEDPPQVYSEFQANLAYIRPCLKQATKQTITSDTENVEKWEPSYTATGM